MNSERACHLSEERVRVARKGFALFPDSIVFLLFMFLCVLLMWAAVQGIMHLVFGLVQQDVPGDIFELLLRIVILLFFSTGCLVLGLNVSDRMVDHPSGYPTPGHTFIRFFMWLSVFAGLFSLVHLIVSWFGMSGGES